MVVKKLPANAGDVTDVGLISELERSLGEGHGSILGNTPVPCPENPMDREAWQATVHGATKSRTQLKQPSGTCAHLQPAITPRAEG